MKKNCVVCGKEFEAKRANHLTCCRDHSVKWRERPEARKLARARYKEKHPYAAAKAHQRWKERHPERAREIRRRLSAAFRSKHPDRNREQQIKYARSPAGREASRRSSRNFHQKTATFHNALKFLSRLEATMQQVMVTKEASDEEMQSDIALMTTEKLKEEFAQGLRLAADTLKRLALVLAELERRGEKVEGDKPLLNMLRKIASGELVVDVVVKFAGRPWTLGRVMRLPAEEQQQILDDGLTANEIDDKYRTRPRKPPSPASRCVAGTRDTPTIKEMAAKASPGDLVEMLMDMVQAHPDPYAVARKLIHELMKVKKTRETMSFSEAGH